MASLSEQLACAKRELALRRSVYPKWTREGRMTDAKAAHEIGCMEAIVLTLEKMKMLEDVSQELQLE